MIVVIEEFVLCMIDFTLFFTNVFLVFCLIKVQFSVRLGKYQIQTRPNRKVAL